MQARKPERDPEVAPAQAASGTDEGSSANGSGDEWGYTPMSEWGLDDS